MKIVADSSVMYSVKEGAARDIEVLPLTVAMGDESWLEYEDISSEEFLKRIEEGQMPTSASPPPGITLEAYDTEEEVLHITMAEGLSGAYDTATCLQKQAPHPERISVINSKTLCIPHRALALRAVELAHQKVDREACLQHLQEMIDSVHSYLIPEDFDYLKRGGRLTPLAAKIVGMLKAVPVLKQTEDGLRLEKLTVARSFKKAMGSIIADLEKVHFNENFFVGISHADNPERATTAMQHILERFPKCRNGIFNLGPAFITQGGPECVAIQVIDLSSCPDLAIA